MKKSNSAKFFWYPLTMLFIIFIALYIALESGYYETKISEKTHLTQEKIQEFETDIQNGVAVDIKDYLEDDYIDYSSKMSKAGVKVSQGIEEFMTDGLNHLFKVLDTLI